MRHKWKFSGLGQCSNFRLTLFTGQCCHLKCSPVCLRRVCTGPSASPTVGSVCNSRFVMRFDLNLRDYVESSSVRIFRRIRWFANSDYYFRHVCLYARSHRTDFHEIWYVSIFRTSFKKIQVWSKFGKNFGYFMWRPVWIDDNISLNSSQNKKCFTQKL
jgi:hypothetical protein